MTQGSGAGHEHARDGGGAHRIAGHGQLHGSPKVQPSRFPHLPVLSIIEGARLEPCGGVLVEGGPGNDSTPPMVDERAS